MRCRFRPTMHAKLQMVERGISKDEAVDSVTRGVRRRQGPKVIAHLRKIEVVYIPTRCNLVVLTTYRRGD